MPKHEIGTLSEFPEGQGSRVEVNGLTIAVVNVENELYGISDLCPHKNLPLSPVGQERIVSGNESDGPDDEERVTLGDVNKDELTINCPWHDLTWELETGDCPVTEQSIGTFGIEVKDDDTVYVVF